MRGSLQLVEMLNNLETIQTFGDDDDDDDDDYYYYYYY